MQTEFNLDLCAKALATIGHFENTMPGVSAKPGKFNEALKAIHVSRVFTEAEYDALGVTREIIGNAFAGTKTGIDAEVRSTFLTTAKDKLNAALGIAPVELVAAVAIGTAPEFTGDR